MKADSPVPSARTREAIRDRRAGPDAAAWRRAMRHVHGILKRPLRIERRGLNLHLVIVERRRAQDAGMPATPAEVRAALRARLGALGREFTQEKMRQLMVVHRELGRDDWQAVAALPAAVLRKALMQAEMLASGGSSPALEVLIERLRRLKAEGQERELARRARPGNVGTEPEASDGSPEDSQHSALGWFDTQAEPTAPPAAP